MLLKEFFVPLNHDEIMRIAHLARIEISAVEAAQMQVPLNDIFGLIEAMQAVNTEGIAPMSHAQDLMLRLREDAVTEPDQHALFQAAAPQVEGGLYLVPKVIE